MTNLEAVQFGQLDSTGIPTTLADGTSLPKARRKVGHVP